MRDPVVSEESGAYVWFSDELDEKQRESVTKSVDAVVTRSRARYTALASDYEARSAFFAPHMRLVEEDATAVKALTELDDRRKARFQERSVVDEWPAAKEDFVPAFGGSDAPGIEVFPLPYHFAWEWHNGNPPSTSTSDRLDGTIRVANGVAFDSERSDAHAGFGVFLTTNVPRAVIGRSLRRSDHTWWVSAGGFGGDATAEGGLEMTALEDGRFLDAVADKRFRRRVSDGESASEPFQLGLTTGNPLELTWTMQPNKGYTFNVGGWVFCEQHFGFGPGGFSYASAEVRAQVSALTVSE
jgi:hypothetical protein